MEKVSSPEVIAFYRSWNDMINRCYNATDKDYPLYGKIGVRVDPRWFCFANFYEDIKLLPGYYNKLKYPNKYQLDKDYLQRHLPKSQRVYSKDTCIWISKFDNIALISAENKSLSGYHGVIYRDNGFCVRYYNRYYGKYSNDIAAANAYNHLYELLNRSNQFNNIPIINQNIPYMSPEETMNYIINPKIMCKIVQPK